MRLLAIGLAALVGLAAGCGGGNEAQEAPAEPAATVAAEETEGATEPSDPGAAVAEEPKGELGDLDAMAERGYIRALVVYSKTFYFLDGARQRGISYDGLKEFEKFLNQKLKRRRPLQIAFLPVRRDELIPSLIAGRGDLALGNLTITPERLELVDFSTPALSDTQEWVITGPGRSELKSVDDLAGQEVHVRASSSYYESLLALNERFRREGKAEVRIEAADENLEDEDLLEMVNAGMIPAAVCDSHKAEFWAQILDKLTLNRIAPIRTGGAVGWAMRKNSPLLKAEADEFVTANRAGTLLGNMLLKRYLGDTRWVRPALAGPEVKKLDAVEPFFQSYGEQYSVPPLLLAAQGYQESGLDQNVKSRVGAVGIMQLMPDTAAEAPISIPRIDNPEQNIHAGAKYIRHIVDSYFNDPEISDLDKGLLAMASYNAGPNRIRRLRAEAAAQGLDPNVWFGNVELVAAREIGRETVVYTANVYKYYVAYRLAEKRKQDREKARSANR